MLKNPNKIQIPFPNSVWGPETLSNLVLLSFQLKIDSRNSSLRRHFPRPPGERRLCGTFGGVSAQEKKLGVPTTPQMVLKLLQGHEDSEYVLSFEIG